MRTSFLKIGMISALFISSTAVGFSQEKKNQTPSEVVNVEKNYTPQVKSKEKVNFNPSVTEENKSKLPVNYITEMEAPKAGFTAQSVNGLLLTNTQNSTLLPNYIKAGYGYNLSTFAEGYYSGTFGITTLWAKLNHDRSVRDVSPLPENSVYSHSDASVGARVDIGRYDVGASVKYSYNSFTNNSMYIAPEGTGFAVEKFKNDVISGQAFIKAKKKGEIFDHFTLDAGYYNGKEASREFEIVGNTRINVPIKNWTLAIDASLGYYDTKTGYTDDVNSESLLHFNALPSITYKNSHWDVMVGARIGLLTGNGPDGVKFHIMPEVKASYSITEGLMTVYAALTSGYKVNTLTELAYQCPYMSPLNPSFYSHEKYNAKIGISGVVSSAWHYDFYVSYVKENRSPAWVDVITFDEHSSWYAQYITLQDEIGVLTANASATYTINNHHNVSAFVQYNNAASEMFSKALYIPDFRIGASYRGSIVKDKIDLYGRIVYNSSSKAFVYGDVIEDNEEKNIDGYIEYMGEASYNINKRWSVFIQAKNSIDGRIPMYYGYTAPGFRGILGVKFNF